MGKFVKGLYFSPDDDGAGSGAGGEGDQAKDDQQQDQEKEELGWDAFHASLPEEAQTLIKTHTSGLKSALSDERDARGKVEKDLKSVAGKLEKDSDAQKQVLKLADDVAAGNEKADFYEEAHEEGVSNLKLAYVVAVQDGLISNKGKINFGKMKESYPELFGKKVYPPGDAGDGTSTKLPAKGKTMNDLIREKAGR